MFGSLVIVFFACLIKRIQGVWKLEFVVLSTMKFGSLKIEVCFVCLQKRLNPLSFIFCLSKRDQLIGEIECFCTLGIAKQIYHHRRYKIHGSSKILS